jgi:hypothetical protein
MGFKIVEYYIRHVISDGIAELRKNPDLLDDVFAELTCSPLDQMYGKKIVDEIKCFFKDNDIPVLAAYGQNQIQLPCISVHLISSQEDQDYRSMQDHWGFIRTPKKASVLAGPVYAKEYDPETGKLTFDKSVDLSKVVKGRKLFARRDDTVYTLVPTFKINKNVPAYELEDQFVHVVDSTGGIPERVDFSELYILSSIDFEIHRLALTHFRENFEVRVNAQTNTDQAIWLYYIVSYILMRNKGNFEKLGMESQTYSASEFTRDVGKSPNNIWGRTFRFSFLVQHSWKEEVNAVEIVEVNVNSETNVCIQE